MGQVRWFWLNDAALSVANRIAAVQPEKAHRPDHVLQEARDHLLSQMYITNLEVQGRWSQDEQEEEPGPSMQEWRVVPSSYFSPGLRTEPNEDETSRVGTVKLLWEYNSLRYEDMELGACSWYDLRVRSDDIDHLWPPLPPADAANLAKSIEPSVVRHRDPGGAPRKFKDELLIEIIRIANTPDGLPENKSELKKQLRKFAAPKWGPDETPSEATVSTIVNFVYAQLGLET